MFNLHEIANKALILTSSTSLSNLYNISGNILKSRSVSWQKGLFCAQTPTISQLRARIVSF